MKGRISFSRPFRNDTKEEIVRFCLRKPEGPLPVLILEMGLTEFTLLVTGQLNVACEYVEAFGKESDE